MKFDTTIAPLTPAKFFAGRDKSGAFFVVKKTQNGYIKPVASAKTSAKAVVAAKAFEALEKMSVALTLQVIAKARSL